jgi:hypothetical protein
VAGQNLELGKEAKGLGHIISVPDSDIGQSMVSFPSKMQSDESLTTAKVVPYS